MPASVQVFQTEYNQVIDVSQCPVPYIRHDPPQRAIMLTLLGAISMFHPEMRRHIGTLDDVT